MRMRSLLAALLLVSVLVGGAALGRAYAAEEQDEIQLAEAGAGGGSSQPTAAADPAYADMACGTPMASPACPIDVAAQTRHLQALLDKCDGDQDCFYARIRAENGAHLEELRAFAWLDPSVLGPALATAIDAGLEAIGEAIGGASAGKPLQMHHFATNKNSYFTGDMQRIASKYDLDLDGDWNKERLPQQGRHANEYHKWVLSQMEWIDDLAKGDRETFLQMFESEIKAKVRANPEMLYSAYWR